MRAFTRLTSFMRTFRRRDQRERDLDDEVLSYIEHQTARRMAEGLPRAEARRLALADAGGAEAVKEHTRAAWAGSGLLDALQDTRYGWRTMRRAPGYTLVACLTLALGIGANVAMFTVMRSVLWRALPYPAAERLVSIETEIRGVNGAGAAPGEVLDFRARSRTLQYVSTISGVEAHVRIDGEMERVTAASVSDDLLPLLGAQPASGRLMTARQDVAGDSIVSVIVSDRLARRLGARGSVGTTLEFNNIAAQIVGVLPPGFRLFLPASMATEEDIDVWFPTDVPESRAFRAYKVLARLAPGADAAAAQRELDGLAASFGQEHPSRYRDAALRFHVIPLRGALTSTVAPGLLALGIAVAFVLLLSCVNVANLMLARAAGRARELAVRRALGAGRGRILRQLLTESLLLSAIAGVLGLVLALWGLQVLDWLRPTHLPRQSQVAMDKSVAIFSVAISLGAGLFFGILPALRFGFADAQALRAGRAESPGPGPRRLQRALVVAEIALSIVPLVAAGLMLRSFVNLTQTRLGFDPQAIVTAELPMSFRKFPYRPDSNARFELYSSAIERLEELPGVGAVSAANPLPYGPVHFTRLYGPAGDETPAAQATMQSVMPGYLDVVGTRLLAGRDFTDSDNASRRPVVIIDARIAQALWPGGALGQKLAMLDGRTVTELEVIGVTEPVRARQVRDDRMPHLFLPYHHLPIDMIMVMKTSVSAAALAPAIKKTLGVLDTGRAVHDVKPMSDLVRGAMAETRFMMLVLSGFAVAALLLAGIGLYGTLSYLASQRSREFGVRLALGASSRQILGLVAGEGVALTAIGALIGLAGSMAAARALRGLLYGVEPVDPSTLLAVTGLIALIAVTACLAPAWSAAKVDPTRALRAE